MLLENDTRKKNSGLGIVTVAAAALFLLAELLSVALIRYGASNEGCRNAFYIGNCLIPVWMLNPLPLCLSIIGWKKDRQHKKLYHTAIIVTALAWLVGGALIARYF